VFSALCARKSHDQYATLFLFYSYASHMRTGKNAGEGVEDRQAFGKHGFSAANPYGEDGKAKKLVDKAAKQQRQWAR
jgi:hypothetical protein